MLGLYVYLKTEPFGHNDPYLCCFSGRLHVFLQDFDMKNEKQNVAMSQHFTSILISKKLLPEEKKGSNECYEIGLVFVINVHAGYVGYSLSYKK